MKKTVKIILLLAIAVLAAGSCKKEIFSKKGEKISFGAGAASDATKLSYGSVDGSKNQAINWTVGDKIMIAGKNCPTTVEGASNPATYKVTEVTSGKENYGKIDVDGTGLGLVWGEPGTTHDFYAVYPASKTGASISVSTAGEITGCIIPAVQGYIGTPAAGTTSKGEDAIIVQPDMTNLYMVAKIENVESGSKVSQGGEEVFLDFKPLSTALEFTIENGFDGTDAMKVMSVAVGSEGENPYILNGGFEVDMTEDGLYERPWTRHTESSPTASNSKVAINFSSPVEVAKGGKLNFTFFLNPGNFASYSTGVDVKDLYFEITFKDNRDATGVKTLTRKAVMKKKNGDAKEAISFPTHKKTHIYGLLVPEYITFDIEGDVVVVPWDEETESKLQFGQEMVDVEVEDRVTGNVKDQLVVANTGTEDAYLRVALVGGWKNSSDQFIQNWDETQGTFTGLLGTDWIKGTDGYYYYTKPVDGTDSTPVETGSKLFTQYTAPEAPVVGLHLCLDVIVQGVRYESDKSSVTQAWGATIAAELKTK